MNAQQKLKRRMIAHIKRVYPGAKPTRRRWKFYSAAPDNKVELIMYYDKPNPGGRGDTSCIMRESELV